MLDKSLVTLRPLQESDINDQYIQWFQDPDVNEYLDSRNFTAQESIDYMNAGRENNTYYMYAILDNISQKHIGNLKVGPINWMHMISDLVTIIGNKDFWGKGYATQAVRAGIEIAFHELGMRKLCAGVAEGNEGSIKAYTKAGFKVEARLKGEKLINGDVRDLILIGCFNPKFFPDEAAA
jgi:[ribosomal protein S5]-alanine N-acetyltransferase